MKKAAWLGLFIALVLAFPTTTFGQTYEEEVRVFDASFTISQDGSVTVQETIVYDFGLNDRHGIERFISYKYDRDAGNYTIRIADIAATDAAGNELPTDISKSGDFIYMRIGDPDSTITGVHEYVITYTVERAINFFEDHDEFYWNVTGSDWEWPIAASTATVALPDNAVLDEVETACYTGAYGSTAQDCTVSSQDRTLKFSSDAGLLSYEGMSIVIGFPKGVITEPTTGQTIGYFVQDNWILILPILFWVFLHILWSKKGKDPKGRGTIVPHYEPPLGMRPAEVGTLWDEKADTKEISATIIDFAVRGYMKIKYISKKNYEFIKLKEASGEFNSMEHTLWEALFGSKASIQLTSLKDKFYKHIAELNKNMYELLVERGLYTKNPTAVRGIYVGIAAIIIFGLVMLAAQIATPLAWFSILLTSALLIVYGILMPQKTVQGAISKEEALGFKWFLSVTEKERLKFHNAPEKKPEQFEQFLPYAMVFGVEKEWAEQFKDLYTQEPSWYEGDPGQAFSAIYFAVALSTMNSSMKSAFTSRPSSAGSGSSGFGGGGFSGGGFGGGGGGSW